MDAGPCYWRLAEKRGRQPAIPEKAITIYTEVLPLNMKILRLQIS
jgi:hypothetical protein